MPKEDYLQKHLEKLTRVIAAMMGFRDKGFPEESLHIADKTFKELLNCNIDELAILSAQRFIDIIRNEKFNSSHLEAIAQITHETAKTYSTLGKLEIAFSFYSKALQIYYLLNEKDKTFSFQREEIISTLLETTKNA